MKTIKNVGIYTTSLYQWMIWLYEGFERKVDQVNFYTLGIRGSNPKGGMELIKKREEVKILPKKNFLGEHIVSPFLLLRTIKHNQTDCLLLYNATSLLTILLCIIGKLRGLCVVFIIEENRILIDKTSPLHTMLSQIKKKMTKIAIQKADVLMVASNASKEYLTKMRCNPYKIYLASYGTNIGYFSQIEQKTPIIERLRLTSNEGNKVVLYAGGFYHHKGIEYVVNAIIDKRMEDITFVIPEFGPLFSKYKNMLEHMTNVRLIPPIPIEYMPHLYSVVDILIVPSISTELDCERSPNVIIEAMACGKAIVATNIGGIPSILGDAGILIPEKDVEALVLALVRLSTDDFLLKKLEDKARARSTKRLDNKKYVEMIINICNEKCAKPMEI